MLKYISWRSQRSVAASAAIIALSLAFGGIAAAVEEGDSAPSSPARVAERQNAAEIYRARCAECHGEAGDGKDNARASLVLPERYELLRRDTPPYDFRHSGQSNHPHGTAEEPTRDQLAAIGDYIQYALATQLPDGNLERGAKIYRRTCSVCHGDNGNGASWARTTLNPPPFDFTSPKALSLSRLHMVNTVSHGSPKSAMMGFTTQLSRRDIVDVVDYVRSKFFTAGLSDTSAQGHGRQAHGDGPADMGAALPRGLSGDGGRGGDLYRTNCVACHGENGDGKGPRAYFFVFRKPADFGSPSARQTLNRPHLFASISDGVVGSEMPAWSKVLADQQIADVAEYVFTTFVRPMAADGRTGTHDGTVAKPTDPAATQGQTGHDRATPAAKEPVKKK